MSRLLRWFFQGLVVVGPLALTLYVCWKVFSTIDELLGLPIRGVGFVLTIALVIVVGFLASNLVTKGALGIVERLLARVPFVRLVYSSTKDMLDAFVGEKRRFDRPVTIAITADGGTRVFGFITEPSLGRFGMDEHVAVYVPQSYGLAGNLLAVPRQRVTLLEMDSATVMAFVVSGGVAGRKAG
ncbi:MAG: DUF502 domain-containing protein [Gemmatimonadota bacterium]|nr:DUF502 domain-containing protein [Gemmatimonadota bacterium]